MWWRFLLIAIYLLLLLVLSRILDVVVYYQNGFIAHKLLDPVSFGVQKLKTILDQRGLNYVGIADKTDFTKLVKGSGSLTEGEIETSTILTDSNDEELTIFTCSDHFLEKVEDSKDSAWLIQVINKNQLPVTIHRSWKYLERKISKFGIKNGVVNCTLDSSLCHKKGWMSSQLILALPEGEKPKDQVVLKSLPSQTTPDQVANWVETQLSARFHEISSIYHLNQDWFFESKDANRDIDNSFIEDIDLNRLKPNACDFCFKNVCRDYNMLQELKSNSCKINDFSNHSFCTSKHKYAFCQSKNFCRNIVNLEYDNDTKDALNNQLEYVCSNHTRNNNMRKSFKIMSKSYELDENIYAQSNYRFLYAEKNIEDSFMRSRYVTQYPKIKEDFEKVKVIFMSPLNLIPMFLSALSVKFSGRVKFGFFHKNVASDFGKKYEKLISNYKKSVNKDNIDDFEKTFSMESGDYIVSTPEGKIFYGKGQKGQFPRYNSFTFFLKTLCPEVNDIFIISLILINAATCLNLLLSRIHSMAIRALETILLLLKTNFVLLLAWVFVLGLLQLSESHVVVDYLLSWLRYVALSKYADYFRDDYLRIVEGNWGPAAMLLIAYLYLIYFTKNQFSIANDDVEVSSLISFSRRGLLMQTLFREQTTNEDITGGTDTIEASMEMLIESMANPRLWLEPIVSPLYVHELPVWRFGCFATDGTDSETGEMEVSHCRCPSMRQKRGDAEDRLDEERAKLVMDGDYICTCGHRNDESHSTLENNHSTNDSRFESDSDLEPEELWTGPEGMIPAESCSICLEKYRKGVVICGLPCGHHYHQTCIKLWLMRDHHCCPICRWPSYKRKMH